MVTAMAEEKLRISKGPKKKMAAKKAAAEQALSIKMKMPDEASEQSIWMLRSPESKKQDPDLEVIDLTADAQPEFLMSPIGLTETNQ